MFYRILRNLRLLAFLSLHMLPVRAAQQLLVVVLMVKNEAHVICPTLQPFVDAGVDSFFIFDTGSTDGTPEVVADYFKKNGIKHGYVAQESFVDFATSRNRALELAEQQFPRAIFMIMPDAEWYLQNVAQLLDFCWRHQRDKFNAYLMRLNTPDHDFFLPRLMRTKARLRFTGAVHEDLDVQEAKQIPQEIFFKVRPSKNGKLATKQRLLRDLNILLQKHADEQSDTRTIFYLAQTHACLGHYEEAYRLYRSCVELSLADRSISWHTSQAYQACYNAAAIVDEQLCKTNPDAFSWDIAQEHYLEAFSICPNRVEPLVWIAQYYWHENNMALCFLFAHYAAELPYPEEVMGMVESSMYQFTRFALLGACAGNIGKIDVSEWALRKALEARPDEIYLQKNLEFVLQQKRT